jgi:hypothetical protein
VRAPTGVRAAPPSPRSSRNCDDRSTSAAARWRCLPAFADHHASGEPLAERFEATLAVVGRQSGREPQGGIENAARAVANKGLSRFDQPPIERARANGHVAGAVANHVDPLGLFVIGVDKSASLKRATGARAARRPWRTRVPAPIGGKALSSPVGRAWRRVPARRPVEGAVADHIT